MKREMKREMKKVFRKVFLLLAVLALLIAAIAALLVSKPLTVAAAEEFPIFGYGVGEFAIKGDVERQAEQMIKGWGNKKPAEITVQGFADKTGKAAENDLVARDRAEQMMFFLESRTDVSRIASVSKGDSENARKVTVIVEFVSPPAEKRSSIVKKSAIFWQIFLRVSTITLGAIVLVGLFFWSFFPDRLFYEPKQEKNDRARKRIEFKSLSSEPTLEEWVEVGDYLVRITSVGGLWYSPFCVSLGGPFIVEWSRKKIVSSIRRCLVNPKFSEQIKILQEKGQIKPIDEGEIG